MGYTPDLSWIPQYLPFTRTVTHTPYVGGVAGTTEEIEYATRRRITVRESTSLGIEPTATVFSIPAATLNQHFPRQGDKLLDQTDSRTYRVKATRHDFPGVWVKCFCVESIEDT